MISIKVNLFFIYGVSVLFIAVVCETSQNQDMYLTALKHSQLNQADGSDNSIQGYNYQQSPEISYVPSIEVSNIYKEPSNSISEYGAPSVNQVNGNDATTSYNRPSSNYGAPVYNYGTPEPTYSAPSSNYGPPANSYGPPEPNHHPPSPVYGPPSHPLPNYAPVPIYFKPVPYPHYLHDHWPLLAKLKAKLNLFTIGKLLLKLVIFKKVIKFISFICLLLILPKLKNLFKENMSNDTSSSDSSRKLYSKDFLIEDRIEELYQFALKSLGKEF